MYVSATHTAPFLLVIEVCFTSECIGNTQCDCEHAHMYSDAVFTLAYSVVLHDTAAVDCGCSW